MLSMLKIAEYSDKFLAQIFKMFLFVPIQSGALQILTDRRRATNFKCTQACEGLDLSLFFRHVGLWEVSEWRVL